MANKTWFPPLMLGITVLMVVVLFVTSASALTYLMFIRDQPGTLVVRDPHSTTVVKCVPIVEHGPAGLPEWECTITVNGGVGRKPTQYAGWPFGGIVGHAQPVSLSWHDNPRYVEIVLSSGERLWLKWDRNAEERARASGDFHYFLNPRYEIQKAP